MPRYWPTIASHASSLRPTTASWKISKQKRSSEPSPLRKRNVSSRQRRASSTSGSSRTLILVYSGSTKPFSGGVDLLCTLRRSRAVAFSASPALQPAWACWLLAAPLHQPQRQPPPPPQLLHRPPSRRPPRPRPPRLPQWPRQPQPLPQHLRSHPRPSRVPPPPIR